MEGGYGGREAQTFIMVESCAVRLVSKVIPVSYGENLPTGGKLRRGVECCGRM